MASIESPRCAEARDGEGDVFIVAYAMHPVATGASGTPWSSLEIDWRRMHAAKTYGELGGLRRREICGANPSHNKCNEGLRTPNPLLLSASHHPNRQTRPPPT